MKKMILQLVAVLGVGAILVIFFHTRHLPKEHTQKDAFSPNQRRKVPENGLTLMTDKASYSPDENIKLTGLFRDRQYSGDLKIQSFHLQRKLKEGTVHAKNGRFFTNIKLPDQDFQGYLIKVNTLSTPSITSTIGVDISSDWSKFPRYGFLSEFGDKPEEEIQTNLAELNRFHLNGLQFYDYHYKHHQPLKMNGDVPADHWQNIANRQISLNTIERYINGAHHLNMKAMGYNLLYGTFENAVQDGVNPDWYLYRDKFRKTNDFYPLPDTWKSNILLTNPNHPGWQQFIINQQKNVYKHLNFDGWHIDQLGDRGEVFNEHGEPILLDQAFGPFLQNIKYQTQSKRIVMNAVNQYGQTEIAKSPVDFLYTEVWNPNKYFGDLKKIIDENGIASNQTKNTVLAAYMDYNHSNSKGEFNEAGILLSDSVIFAAGGSHIELGEHMLSQEYFPHDQLTMSESLRNQLISYYDFLVAYQNLLRDDLTEINVPIQTSSGVSLSSNAEQGKIWTFSKQKENCKILHFLNFTNANSMEWRDTDGTQVRPGKKENIQIIVKDNSIPRKIWMASPNQSGGLPKELSFSHKNGEISFTLPSIEYWDMVVMEY
ncbi:MAG: glycoside hydrolase family 66 protein [Bacillota bacterium]|nr:glycoside hydrolase family 66 protein [Bacillota bacterium]MDP4170822.1 glycoside hydrolase family 66 protein [Bacillota bacterium]